MEKKVDRYLTFISCLQKYLQNLDYCWCLMYDCIMINHQIFASSQCIPSLTCLSLQMLQKLFHTSTGRKTRIKNVSRETPWPEKTQSERIYESANKITSFWAAECRAWRLWWLRFNKRYSTKWVNPLIRSMNSGNHLVNWLDWYNLYRWKNGLLNNVFRKFSTI